MPLRKIISVKLCGFLFFCSLGAGAQPVIDRYEVSGSDTDTLIASIDLNGPKGGWGLTSHNWEVGYSFTIAKGKYTLTDANVKHSVRVDLPTWKGYSVASTCMQQSWDAMYANLKKHEDKHVELGNGVSEKLKQALLAIPTQNSRAELEKIANQRISEIHQENHAIQIKFDADTDHGRNAGSETIVLKRC